MAFALSLHLLVSAVAGIIQADPTGPLRPLAAADAVLCTGTDMRTLPGASSEPTAGTLHAAGNALCALCAPLLPDALPTLPGPAPALAALTVQTFPSAPAVPDPSRPHRPQPRAPPVVS